MRIAAIVAFWFGLTLVAWAGPAAVRVVSQTVGTDELLLALAEPAQIAALSHLSRDPVYSAVANEAKTYPQLALNTDFEGVLKFRPTLFLCADYSRAELVAQAKRAGVKVIVIDRYRTLEDAYENLRVVARELGPEAEARAARIIADCERRVTALRERLRGVKPVRVIAPSTYGIISGYETTFQDLCEHAGAENLAATLGGLHGHAMPPHEQMLTWPIDRVIVPGANVEAALAPFKQLSPYKFMPAVIENRAVLIEHYQLSCVTHHRVEGYERLARGLHPERFK